MLTCTLRPGSNLYVKQNARANLAAFGFGGPRGGTNPDQVFSSSLVEPVNNYSTVIGTLRHTYHVGDGEHYYSPAHCAQKCNELSEYNRNYKNNTFPYMNGAYPKCNMFTIHEDSIGGFPESVVCTFFQSSWDSQHAHAQSEVLRDGVNRSSSACKIYQRLDYDVSPICVLDSCKGSQYYAGGDCSGWGPGYCRRGNGTAQL